MISYMTKPQTQLTIGGTVIDSPQSFDIIRVENGFDSGTIVIANTASKYYPSPATKGASAKLEVKDSSEASYVTLLEGRTRQACPELSLAGEFLRLKCDGAGYGLAETVCADEYGSESTHTSLDTLTEIITDATNGLIPNWVNKILGGAASGFAYTTTNVATINDVIKYLYFPYKPCNKTLDDICDIVTALKAGSAGAHWIVTPTADLRVKLLDGTQTGWTKYYGNSQANATVEQGVDFTAFKYDELERESNYVVYYGVWRRPGNGDSWTENSSSLWNHTVTDMEVTDEATVKLVGNYSLRLESPNGVGGFAWYPSAQTANWDFTKISTPTHVPTVNFHFRRSGTISDVNIAFCTTDQNNNYNYGFSSLLSSANTWYHVKLPLGPYWEQWNESGATFAWTKINSPDWANIDFIQLTWSAAAGIYGYLDGLYIGDVPLCRVAKKSDATINTQKLKVKVITDNIGKDDSLVATDDSGTMAHMAYAELLRGQTTPIVGTISVPMIKDLLPGQLLHVHACKTATGAFNINKDMRVTRIHHILDVERGFLSEITVTDDLTNAHSRMSYTDFNAVLANTRPEFQDRQATSLKAGEVNINVARLVKEY